MAYEKNILDRLTAATQLADDLRLAVDRGKRVFAANGNGGKR